MAWHGKDDLPLYGPMVTELTGAYCSKLTHKQLETYGFVLSTVAPYGQWWPDAKADLEIKSWASFIQKMKNLHNLLLPLPKIQNQR